MALLYAAEYHAEFKAGLGPLLRARLEHSWAEFMVAHSLSEK